MAKEQKQETTEQDEIAAMLASFGSSNIQLEDVVDEEEPKEEAPVEEPEVEEDEETEDTPDEEADDPFAEERQKYEEEIAALRAQVAGTPTQEEQPVPEPVRVPTISELIPNDEAFEAILESRETFAAFLQNFAQTVRATVLQDLPVVVDQSVSRQATLKKVVEDFYTKNAELRPFMRFVGFTVSQVQAEHVDWPMEKVLAEAAARARKELSLSPTAEKIENQRQEQKGGGKPAFAKKPRGQRGAPEPPLSDERRQIADMLKLAR